MTHYQTLGVPTNASPDEIKRAYRKESMKHHPDRHPNADETGKRIAQENFLKAKEAFDVLSDINKRAAYDLKIKASLNPNKKPSKSADEFRREFEQRWTDSRFGADWDPNEDLKKRRHAFRDRYDDVLAANSSIKATVVLTMEDCFAGKSVEFSYRQKNGAERTIRAKIPRSVKHGQTLKFSGMGAIDNSKVPAGDLLVDIRIEDPNWERVGYDLYLATPISSMDMMLGGTVMVPTIDGSLLDVTIRPGTQPETKIRIMGRGLYDDQGKRGDMFLDLKVIIPKLDPNNTRVRELMDELKHLTTL